MLTLFCLFPQPLHSPQPCTPPLQVGVLTRSVLDDGRGFARSKVFKHSHESDTGGWLQTLAVGCNPLCRTLSSCCATGCTATLHAARSSAITACPPACTPSPGRTSSIGQHTLCLDSRGGILNDPSFRTQSIADYVKQASKVGCRAAV